MDSYQALDLCTKLSLDNIWKRWVQECNEKNKTHSEQIHHNHVEYNSEGSEKTNKYWYATFKVCYIDKNFYYLKVYFSGKKDKKRLHYDAVYDEKKRHIKWDDSNIWKQMYYHKKQLF